MIINDLANFDRIMDKKTISNIESNPKSYLRWAGSKKKLIPSILSEIPNSFNSYHEPFLGFGQLFFAIKPNKAILNDINTELINTYKCIATEPKKLCGLLKEFVANEENYYNLRSTEVSELSSIERSARFIILNRYCFNGLYRVNKKGKFNVPYGGNTRNGKLPNMEELISLKKLLSKHTILNMDFNNAIEENISKNDFVFIDPPYLSKKKRIFGEYDSSSLNHVDLNRLFSLIKLLDSKNVKFLMTYNDCEEIGELLNNFWVTRIESKRSINCKVDRRNVKYTELLIKNF